MGIAVEYTRALKLLQESAAKQRNHPTIRYHLGMTYYQIGQMNQAKTELQAALQLQQDFAGAEQVRELLAQIER
ncbi:MAG: tetratricopeptide repeat protein [Candidatus Tectomicrobia bacterium]|uniref:Tetratricopeptide repeat protein n=1 Tax=Tectimicrobiota bacterium TaxID=2528274 RepID=A0A937W7E0_UNCTE|nr:tetratricopeptide repeat protein [Candidatus Tectomicrobia bacterium]